MTITTQQIIDALSRTRYPGMQQDLVASGIADPDSIRIEGRKVSLTLRFSKPGDPFVKSVVKAAEAAILAYADPSIDIKGNISVVVPQPQPAAERLLPGVANIIAVSSGKGGVGKSAVAANLAVALAQAGYRVGLLDADIYGPSQPKMFGVENAQPMMSTVNGKDLIEPVESHGVKLLSIGFFAPKDDALIWRGAMASNALKQLIGEANWGALDYFLIDLPPGTGDLHLTLVQTLTLTGAIVVTTPQDVALADARKGLNMFANKKVDVPILGLIENMAWFTPAELPGNKYYIFGKEGGLRLAEEMHIPFLGQIPLVQSIRESGDHGSPIALNGDDPAANAFRTLASNLVSQIEKLGHSC